MFASAVTVTPQQANSPGARGLRKHRRRQCDTVRTTHVCGSLPPLIRSRREPRIAACRGSFTRRCVAPGYLLESGCRTGLYTKNDAFCVKLVEDRFQEMTTLLLHWCEGGDSRHLLLAITFPSGNFDVHDQLKPQLKWLYMNKQKSAHCADVWDLSLGLRRIYCVQSMSWYFVFRSDQRDFELCIEMQSSE